MVAQALALLGQVEEGDEGVCFAAAIGHLELLDRLTALPGQAQEDIPHQLLHPVGGVGAGEEHRRFVVDGRRFPGAHAVQVGGELVQSQTPRAHILAQGAELVPGRNCH